MESKRYRELRYHDFLNALGKLDPTKPRYSETCASMGQVYQAYVLNELLEEVAEIRAELIKLNKKEAEAL